MEITELEQKTSYCDSVPPGGTASSSTMEVDPPTDSAAPGEEGLHPLKRSNSAPNVNVLVSTAPISSLPSPSRFNPSGFSLNDNARTTERVRRFSTSSMALNAPATPVKTPSRLVQIKHEESVAVKDREVAHEREIQSTMQLSQSMEEIFVDDSFASHHQHHHHGTSSSLPVPAMIEGRRPKSLGEPLHIQVSQYYPYASSPSPTRLGKQCFSPSLQQPVYRSSGLTPSPSPSPTRKAFASPLSRRSLSPITLRPSPLGNPGTKRKMDLDGDRMDTFCSPAKRFHACSPGGSTPERGHLAYHQLLHSVSSSSFDGGNSPDQRVPNTSSHGATPNTSSPASFFRPVRESTESRGTDSEASDMAETTDISENTDLSSSNMLNTSQLSESGVETMQVSACGISSAPGNPTSSPNVVMSSSSPSSMGAISVSQGCIMAQVSSPHGCIMTQVSSPQGCIMTSGSTQQDCIMTNVSASQGCIMTPVSTTPIPVQTSVPKVHYFSPSKVTQV